MRLDPETIHTRIAQLLQSRKSFVVATILQTKGSCPQKPGARMIIHPDGSFEFTIGGGTFEAEVIRDGRSSFTSDAPAIREYKLTKSELGMYCQGLVQVNFERYQPAPQLVVFGGGHVGQALASLAAASELFRVVVIDDRKEYAARKRHPKADLAIHTDHAWEKNVPDVDEFTYVVVVTRCHATDQILVRRYLDKPAAYLGLIGSHAKIRQFFREMEEDGVSPALLQRLHAPIGIPIGGKSPAEVAISILAEVVQTKNRVAASVPAQLKVTGRRP